MKAQGPEQRLVPIAVEFLTQCLSYPPESVCHEVPTPWGRPDIVASSNLGTPVGEIPTRSGHRLLELIRREGPVELSALAERLGMDPPAIRKRVSDLLMRGLLKRDGNSLEAGPEALGGGRICAVELKVRDHRRGLRQALRYGTFADEVYLFLGRSPAGLDLSPFRHSGVGLADLSRQPGLVVPARRLRGRVPFARAIVEDTLRRTYFRRSCS